MRFFVFVILLLSLFNVRAGHIIGGDIYYDYLGNNNYRFNIDIFLECNSNAGFDNPLYLAVYDANNNLLQNVAVPFPGFTNVPANFTNPCATNPPVVCSETATYTVIINLPPSANGYTITYQRCCRNPNITNIQNPADTGFTLTCKVPGSGGNMYLNSSPRFTNYPPLLLCSSDQLVFDHSALDPDGDQLVYSLTTPYSGATPNSPAPNPAPPPTYYNLLWAAGFTAANPLGPGASISINPTTGLLTATPNLTGRFVVGIQVEELRNGIVINRTIRDFVFQVFNCQISMQAILPAQDQLPGFSSYCDGLNIDFVNNSFGGTNYSWDFGVPGINTDVSASFEPSYTYPAPGQYEVMLVVNPGWVCTDTTYMTIQVYNPIDVSFTSNDSLCLGGNSYNFVGSTTGDPGTTLTWDFGPNANPTSANGQNVNGVVFDQAGDHDVTVTANIGVCSATFSNSVYVIPEPIADFELPDEIECAGLTIPFVNTTVNAANYLWDFGDNSGIISDVSPTHIYAVPGTYTVTLSAWTSSQCVSETQATFTLNEKLEVEFTSEDSLCFTNNSFNFDGTVSGPPSSVFTWNFGPNASISSSTDTDVFNVNFNTTGSIPITLTGTFENCIESVTHNIYIFQEPNVDFMLMPGRQCVPFSANFVDLSSSETPILYNWDFGDGNTSTEQNPIHVYTQIGQFPVTLSITTSDGCVGTFTITKVDLVDVHPKPEANFSVDPNYTDICHSVVNFTDESIGGDSYFYWFDDSTMHSFEQNPVHLYYTDGWHRPKQIVTNEWGCTDTAYQELFIEPYTIYAPNAFTPDGDEFNNIFKPIVYLDLFEWKLEIYNKWGEVVFESNDIDVGWDGTGPNGRIAQSGAYVWKITYVSCEPINPRRIIYGHISLLK